MADMESPRSLPRLASPRALCVLLLTAYSALTAAAEPLLPPALYSTLHWRLLGPHRGGWATAAAGVPSLPDVYYIGTAGGGVWRTMNAGRTWEPITNTLPDAAVGALAVAPSDSATIYLGTGQPEPRYDIAAGHGVYRSIDAGQHWQAVGLAKSRHIARIWVDPREPRTLLVAAMGPVFGDGGERGLYRSTDGGDSWTQVLAGDARTGACDIVGDPGNPDHLYAATWQLRDKPWLSYFEPKTGAGSALWESQDGGQNWTRLEGQNWPKGPLGRIGLAATRLGDAVRLYATVDSDSDGGVWRSDDGGASWLRVNDDADTFGNWYFSRLVVDPVDFNTVYAMGQSIRRSSDAGASWTIIKGAPGGDDYHDLWINPVQPKRWLAAADQGAVVSVDGGRTWSSWYNQPTGQFYHLAADNRFPYWVYSGQQDSGTVGIASRSDYGSLTYRDWHPVGGDERDYDIPDPADPNIVYGSGLGGRVSRWDARTGQVANVSPTPIPAYGVRPNTVPYRYTWITPLVASSRAPYALYLGAQVLFRSTDRGDHWDIISPDLTGRQDGMPDSAKRCDGEVAIKDASACGYGVIFSIAPSASDSNEVWVGTDNGRLQLTRDGGKSWQNLTPRGIPDWAKIASIDLDPQAPGTAYLAVDNHRQNDFAPHVWRTTDYGKSWKETVRGLPEDRYVAVVRADPVRRGLLYAGTELGVYASFDAGEHWQSLNLDLPSALVNDLLVKNDDLIAATQGRGIWVLDGLAPLRQSSPALASRPLYLLTPPTAYRVRANVSRDTPLPADEPFGENPQVGAVIDYGLGAGLKGPVELEIRDSALNLVRRFSSDDRPDTPAASRYFSEHWVQPAQPLPATPGLHRFVWNLRGPQPHALKGEYSIAATPGRDTAIEPEGAFVPPGRYLLVLKAGGNEVRALLEVAMDPRSSLKPGDAQYAWTYAQGLGSGLDQSATAAAEMQSVRQQLAAHEKTLAADGSRASLLAAVQAMARQLDTGSKDSLASTMGSINERLAQLEADAESTDLPPTAAQQNEAAKQQDRLRTALAGWQTLRTALAPLNAQLKAAGLAAVNPQPTAVVPTEGGKDLP